MNPQRSTIDLLRSVTERSLEYDFTVWFWGDAIAVDGLLDAAELLGDERPFEYVKRFILGWADRDLSWVDHLTPGRALLRIWERDRDGKLLDAAVTLARFLTADVPRAAGAPLYRPDIPTYRHAVWVDSIYHVPPFFAALAHATGDDRWFETAVQELLAHTAVLSHEEQGPFLGHSYDTGSRYLHGYGWGRGAGWALYGMIETLKLLPANHPSYELITTEARRLADALAPIQDESGLWRTLLHDRESYLETSTASFFGAALLAGMRAGLLPPSFTSTAGRAVAATKSRIDADGQLWGVSACTYAGVVNVDDATMYRTLPTEVNVWGQGSALRLLAEQIRSETT